MTVKKIISLVAGFSLLFLFACGPQPLKPQAHLDTPEHHVSTGNKFLELNRLDDALTAFDRARQLDPKFAPAYTGLGIVYGKQGLFDKGLEAMRKADRFANTDNQKVEAWVGFIRLYTDGGEALDRNWLGKAEGFFKQAVRTSPEAAAPFYYMGLAYKKDYHFSAAAEQFRKVLNLGRDFVGEADREYAVIQKIERAMPGTGVGKQIALLDSISRADVAALFIEELRLDELYRNRAPKTFDTDFKSPEKEFKTGEYVKVKPASDIDDHVLKADIDAVIELQIKGLQPYPDHTFKPDKKITRAEFAMMIEDILIKITREDSLATRFIGNESPFPDMRNDSFYFNAAMVCVSRNIMETTDIATGAFGPMKPVTGADALLSIRQMQVLLNKY